jgi:hypothetical protein
MVRAVSKVVLLSTQAFLKGYKAKIIQVDWDGFISPLSIKESIMTPIVVVSGDPESGAILQLEATKSKPRKGTLSVLHSVERTIPTEKDGESFEQQPLPERIRILSWPLNAIFSDIEKRHPLKTAFDGSLVLLRP